MTEILTESFCERCGTRYTFESSAPRRSRVRRAKVFSKGVRNFVLTDDSSFSEAMADARSEEELSATAHQLDAFHRTFNFCLSCRQYTCGSCWNTAEGRCLTCAPDARLEAAAAATDVVVGAEAATDVVVGAEAAPAGEAILAGAWPEKDVSAERLARAVGESAPTDAVEAGAAVPGSVAEPDAEAAAMAEAQLDAEAAAMAGVVIVASGAAGEQAEPEQAEPETGIEAAPIEPGTPGVATVQGLVPGQSLEEAIAAWEAQQVATEIALEAAAEPEPEPVAAEAEPEPEPVAAEPEPAPRVDDVVTQPTWPIAATPAQVPAPVSPAGPTPAAPTPAVPAPWLTVAPDDGSPAPQWPTTPAWPTAGARPGALTTLAGRALVPQGDATALWAASAREVLSAAPAALPAATAAPTPQPCIGCGLSLSASARFCRRCGTRQS